MAAQAEIKTVITAEDRASATVDKFGKNVNKTSLGIGIAVAAIGAAAISFGTDSVKAFSESERASKQLDAVLRSTGQGAGVTKQAAIDLSQSLMKLTAIDDDAILSAENMLLTFTSLGKDEFPGATKAILDTATAMNGGLKPSAEEMRQTSIQLGKALQDPDAGLGALKRVGVNVEELSAKFNENMPIAEKQRLIIQELSKEFGGSADNTGTFSDKMSTLSVNMGNLQEKVGGLLANGLSPLIERTNSFIEQNPVLAQNLTIAATLFGVLTVAVWGLNTAINVLSVSFGGLFGRVVGIVGAIAILYAQMLVVSNAATNFGNSLQGLGNSLNAAWYRATQMGGVLGWLNGMIYNINASAYNLARTLDNLIGKIPILGALMPKLPQLNFPGRAVGGPVTSGMPYIVGEQGPELFVPKQGGTIIPNGQTPSGVTSNTTININVGMMTGSAIEQREAAMRIFENLQDIANTKGQTVGQMIGA